MVNFVNNNSWPGFNQLHSDDKQLWKVKNELHVEEKMLFKDHKLVIPEELRVVIIRWLNGNHLGVEKTIAKGNSLYFWPGMSSDIEKFVKKLQCV